MATDYRVMPFMSWGSWVVKCPRPGCLNAEKRGRCDDGTQGGLEAERFTCRASHGGCGFRCGVDWPIEILAIERMVLARPAPGTRNWSPGETLHDLLKDNMMHGLVPVHELEIHGNELDLFGALEFQPAPVLEAESWRG